MKAGGTTMPDRETTQQERPFGVTAIAVIQAIAAAAAVVGWWRRDPFETGIADPTVYLQSLTVVLALFTLIAAIGLLLLHSSAWSLILLIISVNMGVGLWAYYDGHPNYVTMGLNVISIFYLNSREVRRAFGVARSREHVPIE